MILSVRKESDKMNEKKERDGERGRVDKVVNPL